MKLRYLSNLHFEFIKKIPSGINKICILAGDIGNTFIEYISKNFKKSFVITENHEYQ